MNDITSYENALNDGLYAGGGTTNKKVYVSIRLKYSYERMSEDISDYKKYDKYFYTYDDSNFIELKNQELKGVIGVSKSSWNIADWFIFRDALIVMDYNDFMVLNDTTEINYDDPYQLMKDDCKIFNRLYDHSEKEDLQSKKYDRQTVYQKIIENLVSEFNLHKNEYYNTNKESEIYKIEDFLNPYRTGAFYNWLAKKDIILNSPKDIAKIILEFTSLPYEETGYVSINVKEYTLTIDEILPIVEKGVFKAGQLYKDEQEIILNDKVLKIPKKSQLFFKLKNSKFLEKKDVDEKSNLSELIDKYKLKSIYDINFISEKDIYKYRAKIDEKRAKLGDEKITLGKASLELKKEQVVNEILNIFIEKSINSFKIEYEKDFLSEYSELKTYYDDESDDYEEIFWYDIHLVQFIINTYIEIIKVNWKIFIESKSVKDLNVYSFSNFCSQVEYQLKDFFEQNKDKLEKISDYREIRGNGYLSLYGFERLLKKSVNHYESLPEWFDYKKLSKLYLEKMGIEIYRYYDKKDLPLISQYKDGGATNVPTEFWGNVAGGVLIYSKNTDRYLLLKRSEYVLEPNTWGIISGKLDANENIEEAVKRETEEETGFQLRSIIPAYIFKSNDFTFHNFVSITDEEFIPVLNWENTEYGWFKLNEFPKNLHFGLELLIQNTDLKDLTSKYSDGGEINNTNIISQIWEWFGIKF